MAVKSRREGTRWGTIIPCIITLMAVGELLILMARPSIQDKPHATCPPQVVCPKLRKRQPAAIQAPALARRTDAVAVPPQLSAQGNLPYYDIVAVLFAIASEHDLLRMDAAAHTWLAWKDPAWTFHWMVVLCEDDPGLGPVGCEKSADKAGNRTCGRAAKSVVIVPCKQGYSTIVTKSAEGFRYLSNHFRFKYVVKADIDTMVDMRCIAKQLSRVSPSCPSFAMGKWREAGTSKVFREGEPGAGKYPNEPFFHDSGLDYYPPYMVGWLTVWSADVAHFLGMAGLPSARMPHWKSSWTIDDAAIGSFIVGLDICRLDNPCKIVTDVEYEQFQWHWEGDVTGHKLKIVPDGPVKGFRGPLRDDVPGVGGLANVWVATVEECAQLCRDNQECASFEHSPTVGRRGEVKNCVLDAGSKLGGAPYDDYSVYLKIRENIKPDGPVEGFRGPLDDDVPGVGDLANIFTQTLEECAAKCSANKRCRSFEHSPTFRKTVDMKNCQLNSGVHLAGAKCEDFSLYIRKM